LKKTGLVLWKNTYYSKNKSTFKGINHCIDINGSFLKYKKCIDIFIKGIR